MLNRRALVTAACVLLAACPRKQAPTQDPNVIATVNGEVIARQDFERELSREAQSMDGDAPRTPEQIEPYKQTLLNTLIERAILLQTARSQNVSVSPDELDRRMLALASEYPAGGFEEMLKRSPTTRQELEKKTKDQLTIEKLLDAEVFSRVAITEEQIRNEFNEHPERFQDPEMVHAEQIVVGGLDDAKRIQQQLWQGKKFSDLARRFSLSPDARVGGDLGFFARGQMPPAFDDVVFRLAPNQVSDVVTSDYGFHLFHLVERRAPRKKDLSEVRAQIERALLEQKRAERQLEYVAQLRAKAQIHVNDQTLTTVSARVVPGPTGATP